MEPESSLPHSQLPAICAYSELALSSPNPHTLLPKDTSPIYAWVPQVVSFLQVSSPKPYIRLSSPPYALHAPPISPISLFCFANAITCPL
jgi:hypothetical protein